MSADVHVQVSASVRERGVELRVLLRRGRTLAVLGPNGAGKSTLVQLIAGALRPSSGEVVVDGQVWASPSVLTPSHRRRLGYLEQRPLLFPHLDVLGNVAFGPRSRGLSRQHARHRALQELEAVGCEDLAARSTGELSGGQAQRVALARTLAVDPEVVLLDEPFAALDATVAPELRRLLRERLHGVTTLLVTHDFLDVAALADEVVELADGCVVTSGSVDEALQRPSTRFMAGFVGSNLLHGHGSDGVLLLDDGTRLVSAAPVPDGPARALFPPDSVTLHRGASSGSSRNLVSARVVAVEDRWPAQRVRLEVSGQTFEADVTPAAVRELDIHVGADVIAAVKAVQLSVVPSS